jgi:hypothetical protein
LIRLSKNVYRGQPIVGLEAGEIIFFGGGFSEGLTNGVRSCEKIQILVWHRQVLMNLEVSSEGVTK